jgi:type II secretory pathway component PulC
MKRVLGSRKVASPQLSQWVSFLLSKESLEKHQQIFLLTLFVVLAHALGKISALALKGRPQFPAPQYAFVEPTTPQFNPLTLNQIKNADPFKTRSLKESTGPVADIDCDSAENKTGLPIKLVNSVVLQDSIKSIAAVQIRSDMNLKQVREGDTIDGLARIYRIARLELIIKNLQTGMCEFIPNESVTKDPPPVAIMTPGQAAQFRQQKKIKGIENVGNKFSISKDLLDEKLKDIAGILAEARAIKMQNPDGTLAFKITDIEPGGIFSYLGIQNEDVITSINGKPITDLNEIMSLFGRLKNIDQLQLGIRRQGEESQLDYQMKR